MNEDQGKTMTLRELADALDRGDKIELSFGYNEWEPWQANGWDKYWRFRIVKPEPKLVPHWPALFTYGDGTLGVSDAVFPNIEAAHRHIGVRRFERLVTEYPAVMREVKK